MAMAWCLHVCLALICHKHLSVSVCCIEVTFSACCSETSNASVHQSCMNSHYLMQHCDALMSCTAEDQWDQWDPAFIWQGTFLHNGDRVNRHHHKRQNACITATWPRHNTVLGPGRLAICACCAAEDHWCRRRHGTCKNEP